MEIHKLLRGFDFEPDPVGRTGNFEGPPYRVAIAELFEDHVTVFGTILEHFGFEVLNYANVLHLWEDLPNYRPHVILTHNHRRGRSTYEPAYFSKMIRTYRDSRGEKYPRWGVTARAPGPNHPFRMAEFKEFLAEHFDYSFEIPIEPRRLVGMFEDMTSKFQV